MGNSKLKVWVTCGSLVMVMGLIAHAQPMDRTHLKEVPLDEIKAIYLQCEEFASTTLLDASTAAECSLVSEELLERGFGGSFNQLLEWWRGVRKPERRGAGPGDTLFTAPYQAL